MINRQRVYIIAEAGINHNGSLDNCRRLIDAAADAGCDCVKFQFFKAKDMYPRSAGKLDWKDAQKKYSYDIYKAVESFQLPDQWVAHLVKYCAREKIDFLSSVFDSHGLRFLVQHGMRTIKLSSYSVTNLPLIDACSRYGLPIIMSTGGATLGEIEEAVGVVNKHHNKLTLLHCSIKYPTALSECNLGVIKTLRYAFPDNKIGYSDHTKEISKAPVQAVYLGAKVIEKHITLSKKMPGPDHFFALEPKELRKMVKDIRRVEACVVKNGVRIDKQLFGSSRKKVFEHEKYIRNFCFPIIFSGRDISKGERIYHRDLRIFRRGKKKNGLQPRFAGLFKKYKVRAVRDIACEQPIGWEDIFNA